MSAGTALVTPGPPVRAVGAAAALVWSAWTARLWLLWRGNQLPAFDFGVFSQIVWKIAHGQPGGASLLNNTHWLGDHFQPVLYLYAPILRVFGTPFVLIVCETALVGAAAIPLARIAWRATGSTALGFVVPFAFLLNPATTSAVMFPVHPSTLVAPLLLFAFDAFEGRHPARATALVLLALLCKEDVGFYLVGIGLWLAMVRRDRWVGLGLAGFGAAWSLTCIFVVIPWFRGGAFHMFEWAPSLRDGGWLNPVAVLRTALDSPDKLQLLAVTFGAFGLLSIGDPLVIAIVPFLAERLLGSNPAHVEGAWHYGAPGVAVLAVSAAFAMARLGRRIGPVRAERVGSAILAISTVGSLALTGVLRGSLPTLIQHASDADAHAVDTAVRLVPEGASVLAQDTLVARFADRERVGVIARRPPRDWDYVVLDVTLPDAPRGLPGTLHTLTSAPTHELIYSAAGVAVWRRLKKGQPANTGRAPAAVLSPEIVRYLETH